MYQDLHSIRNVVFTSSTELTGGVCKQGDSRIHVPGRCVKSKL